MCLLIMDKKSISIMIGVFCVLLLLACVVLLVVLHFALERYGVKSKCVRIISGSILICGVLSNIIALCVFIVV